ncbi:hypothetical protein VNO77_18104 [Canavalia gladiata]|uniref:Uncharacterized protein n=1 Tax=Canavalia gladiata TaxID=3824 RepID=A0AAN9LK48_CANGL
MVSNKITASTSRPQKQLVEATTDGVRTMLTDLEKLIDQIIMEKEESVKEKLQRNRENVERQVSTFMSEISRRDSLQTEENTNQMFSSRIDNPICNFKGFRQGPVEKDHINNHDKMSEASIKIPYLGRLPPYTSWVYMPRSQRMRKDQSVIGKKQIYYEKHGGETTICSDDEEEIAGSKDLKYKFSEGEDRVLWMAFGESGINEEVLSIVRLFVHATATEIQERYEILKERNTRNLDQHSEDSGGCEPHTDICLEKSLSAALDSFDNFFCRRCISGKQPVWSEPEGDREPCSDQCYLRLKDVNIWTENSAQGSFQDKRVKPMEEVEGILTSTSSSSKEPGNQSTKAILQEERYNYVTTPFTTEIYCRGDPNSAVPVSGSMRKREVINLDESQNSCKKLKKISDDIVTANSNGTRDQHLDASLKSLVEHNSNKLIASGSTCNGEDDEGVEDAQKDVTNVIEFKQLSNSSEVQAGEMPSISGWKLLEKELYLKGVEMFGRNSSIDSQHGSDYFLDLVQCECSITAVYPLLTIPIVIFFQVSAHALLTLCSCLIARNLLSGLKTCMEVATYLYAGGESMPHGSIPGSIIDKNEKINIERKEGCFLVRQPIRGRVAFLSSCACVNLCTFALWDQEMPSRSRLLRKRGKPKKYNYSRKSAGLPPILRRIAYRKNLDNKQYTPCACPGMCGKQCPCLRNGSCCEKYCGCSRLCKNRFRGCYCAKSQCRSRLCPCFAANRECDPDVCRNCWISCGDGSLGEPPRRGDGQCGNMMLLLGQKQRILLAASNVAGWGAFSKNPVKKNDCLGEYTGELISQREAEKRGKLYDRTNSSFLFDLNDQYVVDAIRKGDKLKFANHSTKPNCYPKVMLVAGDHRIGIFADVNIEAGAELFYDYRYGPEQSPQWIRELNAGPSRKDESAVSHSKTKKHQSH